MALTQAALNAWRTAVDRQAQILENGLATIMRKQPRKKYHNLRVTSKAN